MNWIASLVVFWSLAFSVGATPLARLYSAQGTVDDRLRADAPWRPAKVGTEYVAANAVRTGDNSRGAVLFTDNILVRLHENTLLEFTGTAPVRMDSGKAYFFTRQPKTFPRVDTPVVSAAVRGTEFVVEVLDADQTVITVLDGEVDCRNDFGAVVARPGEQVVTRRGQAPVKRIIVRPWDAVHWALYYPAVLDLADYADALTGADAAHQAGWEALQRRDWDAATRRFAGNDWRDALGRSIAAYHRGELPVAFRELDGVAQAGEPFHLYQAALFLSVGQVEKAEKSLQRCAALHQEAAADEVVRAAAASPRARAAYHALRAIIALTQNQKTDALADATRAVQADATSASAALAMSYAKQAHFQLPDAMRWAGKAVELQPASGLTRARLAELQLGFGQFNEAVRTATAALQQEPENARVVTVLGFAYLTRLETGKAAESFRRAIALDDAAGLPHLGLGLALIRQNKLADGRRELEMAVHLEPGDSLFRSYLGKAFFEEKRDRLAANEYELAKQLDPLDPTPYLYSAYEKLASYRPVEALWDLEDSIRLNDNRAIYRSRFLLDQDQAVRSVGLSQVFTQLGFLEAGRVEAIKSINRDYGNFSAHLLLSGSYFDKPNLTLATTSEQLITRLLAPVNINSVRGEASFNEYSSLFDRQRHQFFFGGEARSGDQFAQGAARVTGAFDRGAYALVYGARYLGGFRDNDDAELTQPSLFFQYQLTPADVINLETIQFTTKQGDNTIGFDPEAGDPDLGREFQSFTQRLGYRHRFAPGSQLVGQALYLDRREHLGDLAPSFPLSSRSTTQLVETVGVRADLQHLQQWQLVTLVAGGAVVEADVEKSQRSVFAGGIRRNSRADFDEQARRGYLYSTWHLGERMDVIGGGNFSYIQYGALTVPPYNSRTAERSAWTPKLGLTAYVTPAVTLRGAYLRTLGSAGSSDVESIEPTQVAGFNQVFDDPVAARAELYGVGADFKLAKRTYAGVEVIHRNVDSPFGAADQPTGSGGGPVSFATFESAEDLLRAYVHQVLDARPPQRWITCWRGGTTSRSARKPSRTGFADR